MYQNIDVMEFWPTYAENAGQSEKTDLLQCVLSMVSSMNPHGRLEHIYLDVYDMLFTSKWDLHAVLEDKAKDFLDADQISERDGSCVLTADLCMDVMTEFFQYMHTYGRTLSREERERIDSAESGLTVYSQEMRQTAYIGKDRMVHAVSEWPQYASDQISLSSRMESIRKEREERARRSRKKSRTEDAACDANMRTAQEEILSLDMSGIADRIQRRYKGQVEAVQEISTVLYEFVRMNEIKTAKRQGTAILLTGPTGTGKTYLVDQIADMLHVPVLKYKISDFSTNGFKGRQLNEIHERIKSEAEKKGLSAENFSDCILYLDEFDKIILPQYTSHGENVMQVLQGQILQLLEEYPLLCICSGCFDFIRKQAERKTPYALGFSDCHPEPETDESADPAVEKITRSDLEKAGGIRELTGRIDRIINLQPLGKEDYKEILLHAQDSALDLMKSRFHTVYKVELVFLDDAIDYIADEAVRRRCGARSLRQILEDYIHGDHITWQLGTMKEARPNRLYISAEDIRQHRMPQFEHSSDRMPSAV